MNKKQPVSEKNGCVYGALFLIVLALILIVSTVFIWPERFAMLGYQSNAAQSAPEINVNVYTSPAAPAGPTKTKICPKEFRNPEYHPEDYDPCVPPTATPTPSPTPGISYPACPADGVTQSSPSPCIPNTPVPTPNIPHCSKDNVGKICMPDPTPTATTYPCVDDLGTPNGVPFCVNNLYGSPIPRR